MMSKKEVATKNNGELIISDTVPNFINKDSMRGQENVSVDDLSIPRLDVIQALSPQRKKSDPAYIDGAEEGMLFNSVTCSLYGTEVFFVPVYFRKEFLIWKDRESGGGFAGAYPSRAEAVAAQETLGELYDVVDTAQHFGMIVHADGSLEEVVVSMAKSKMKASRQLNTLCKMTGGDRFSSVYRISAIEVNGEKGDYFNFKIDRVGYVTEEIYRAGEKLYDAVSSGERDVSRTYDTEAEETDENSEY